MITVTGGRDARIAAIAACQRGRVSRRQLLAAGLRPGQISRLAARGRLHRLHPGVYAVDHPRPVSLGPETAALLAARDGALLHGLSAARLWGLDAVPGEADDPDVHVLIGPRWARPTPGIHLHRSATIAPVDRRVRAGLPVCSPARTFLALALALDVRTLERAYDQAIVTGVLRPREVAEVLERVERHPGAPRLRELAGDLAERGVTRSVAEQRLLELITSAGLPRPRMNVRLHGFEVDAHWPAARLVVEVDGYRFHSSRAAFERDRIRDARLREHGVEVLRVTWRQLEREPFAVIARIAAALARRTAIER